MQGNFYPSKLYQIGALKIVVVFALIWFSCQVNAHRESALTHYEQLLVKKAVSIEQRSPSRVEYISSLFLDTPYQANRLIGSPQTNEKLVIDFRALDCFTYIDYVEALKQSASRQEFELMLPKIRYKNGDINFLSRNHFFIDWKDNNADIQDVTARVSSNTISVNKNINRQSDGSAFIETLPSRTETIQYIPHHSVNQSVLNQLKTGDYIGIYTPIEGLDVTHVGIFIRNDKGVFLRHASSKASVFKVVDSPFMAYIKKTPGIIVYRTDTQN